MSLKVVITPANEQLVEKALLLAKNWQLPYQRYLNDVTGYTLWVTEKSITLQKNDRSLGPLSIDVLTGPLARRCRLASKKNESLIRAIGARGGKNISIIDATAGLGTDAFVLASYGYQVTVVERHKVCAILLSDAIERANKVLTLDLRLVYGDAIDIMKNLTNKPEVIYLDPMFPEKTKSAQVKKGMQYLQEIIGHDIDSQQLLIQAMHSAKDKVVVKRPHWASAIGDVTPNTILKSGKYRFDIYHM